VGVGRGRPARADPRGRSHAERLASRDGYFAPESVIRRVGNSPLTPFLGGGPAVLLQLLGEFEAETFTREKNEMEREMRAFVRAVKAVVPEELQTQIFAEYERRLDESAPDATARVPN
jgi:hypothetical protein